MRRLAYGGAAFVLLLAVEARAAWVAHQFECSSLVAGTDYGCTQVVGAKVDDADGLVALLAVTKAGTSGHIRWIGQVVGGSPVGQITEPFIVDLDTSVWAMNPAGTIVYQRTGSHNGLYVNSASDRAVPASAAIATEGVGTAVAIGDDRSAVGPTGDVLVVVPVSACAAGRVELHRARAIGYEQLQVLANCISALSVGEGPEPAVRGGQVAWRDGNGAWRASVATGSVSRVTGWPDKPLATSLDPEGALLVGAETPASLSLRRVDVQGSETELGLRLPWRDSQWKADAFPTLRKADVSSSGAVALSFAAEQAPKPFALLWPGLDQVAEMKIQADRAGAGPIVLGGTQVLDGFAANSWSLGATALVGFGTTRFVYATAAGPTPSDGGADDAASRPDGGTGDAGVSPDSGAAPDAADAGRGLDAESAPGLRWLASIPRRITSPETAHGIVVSGSAGEVRLRHVTSSPCAFGITQTGTANAYRVTANLVQGTNDVQACQATLEDAGGATEQVSVSFVPPQILPQLSDPQAVEYPEAAHVDLTLENRSDLSWVSGVRVRLDGVRCQRGELHYDLPHGTELVVDSLGAGSSTTTRVRLQDPPWDLDVEECAALLSVRPEMGRLPPEPWATYTIRLAFRRPVFTCEDERLIAVLPRAFRQEPSVVVQSMIRPWSRDEEVSTLQLDSSLESQQVGACCLSAQMLVGPKRLVATRWVVLQENECETPPSERITCSHAPGPPNITRLPEALFMLVLVSILVRRRAGTR